MQGSKTSRLLVFSVLFMLFAVPLSVFIENTESPSLQSQDFEKTSARSQIIWSGVVELTSSYTVNVTDELVLSPCTVVKLSPSLRIYVEGRITAQGTSSCPVVFTQLSTGLHYGIQFNSSSNGRGSLMDNITIEDSVYGITMYDANPRINNVTIINPSRVGIDLFTNSAPIIHDLYIDQAGREVSYSDWRYGLGVSVGAGSTPILDGVYMTDLRIRGLNIWGGSGGLFRNIVIDNVTAEGASALSAGVWVEDSQPLITNISVDKADYGILIRHIDDGGYTRAVVRDCVVSNSMYRGIYLDKANHTNYTNYETADFTNTVVSGTGGSGAKTANIGYAGIEVNATGAWFENTTVEDSTTVGVRLYFVDSSTTFRDLTITNSGDPGQGAHEAGLAIRSSFFAPNFEGLEISGSVGPAVSSTSGGAMQGSDWYLHNNSKQGLFVDSSTLILDDLRLSNNGYSGVHVYDARYVSLSNITSLGNGVSGILDSEKAGIYFEKSNDLESNSGDVTCNFCTVKQSLGAGILVKDSVDLWLNHISLEDNNPSYAPLSIDNGGLNLGQQGGRLHLHDIQIDTERTGSQSGPAMELNKAAAYIDVVTMSGNHSGIVWNADNNGNFISSMSRVQFSGSSCLVLSDHIDLSGQDNTITPFCTGSLIFQNSNVNWSGLVDLTANTVLNLDSFSSLHLHQPSQVDLNNAIIGPSATIDVAWDVEVWAINNNSNGIPQAIIDLTFDQIESSTQEPTNEIGYVKFPNYIGQQWTQSGPSSTTSATISCGYDGISNSSSVVLDQDRVVYCLLPLGNQAPFLIWDSPVDLEIFPSGSIVEFNASNSWDLDNDPLTWEWTSSIDGIIGSDSNFTVNDLSSSQSLSDGIHTITAKVCDDSGNCAQLSRVIELVNQQPVLVVNFDPGLNPWNILEMPRTGLVQVNLTGSYDPEGDDFSCWMSTSYGLQYPSSTSQTCQYVFNYSFPLTSSTGNPAPPSDFFSLSIWLDDGVNTPVEWEFDVELYNEIPTPQFTILRNSNYSEDVVTLDGSLTIDPEGDNLEVEFWSSIDGVLQWSDQESGKVWQGHLSRGFHTIEMRVGDDVLEHVNQTKVTSQQILVENSYPKSIIATPLSSQTYDSSELIQFSANGSGDYDSECSTFPTEGFWHCSQFEPSAGSEFLLVSWESDLDGRLIPTNQDWFMIEGRLSAGTHIVTLAVDDGIHQPVETSITIQVEQSAPYLELATPNDNQIFNSSDYIFWNAVNSQDFDGDNFSMTVRSDLLNEPLLDSVSTSETHISQLPAGTHSIEIQLTDETGKSASTFITLIVQTSAPDAVIDSPTNLQSFIGGDEIILEESSIDADNDIIYREWRVFQSGNFTPLLTYTASLEKITLPPGDYDIQLVIRDSQGEQDQEQVRITIEDTDPEFDDQSIMISPTEMITDELVLFQVSIILLDPDGTTQDVSATLTHNLQVWNFNLSDDDNDGLWEGSIKIRPDQSGRPSLKITARDGVGDDANIDQISRTVIVNDLEQDSASMVFIATGSGIVVLLVIITLIALRRRKKFDELELMESWPAFGRNQEETNQPKEMPKLEGGIVDSAAEVQSEQEEFTIDELLE